MRVIFIPIAARPECAAALNTAFILGHTVGASVIGCHIRSHCYSPVALPSTLGLSGLTNEEAEWQIASIPCHIDPQEDRCYSKRLAECRV